jgi:hypothetical protein
MPYKSKASRSNQLAAGHTSTSEATTGNSSSSAEGAHAQPVVLAHREQVQHDGDSGCLPRRHP